MCEAYGVTFIGHVPRVTLYQTLELLTNLTAYVTSNSF